MKGVSVAYGLNHRNENEISRKLFSMTLRSVGSCYGARIEALNFSSLILLSCCFFEKPKVKPSFIASWHGAINPWSRPNKLITIIALI
jgi:hypothetical protein